jgi:hypothetical protein
MRYTSLLIGAQAGSAWFESYNAPKVVTLQLQTSILDLEKF